MSRAQRVVVVGAGSAGCILAAQLSENPAREVVLIEEGAHLSKVMGGASLDPRLGVGSLELAFDPLVSRSTPALAGIRPIELRSGSVVGGSSAVNGGYFMRPSRDDLKRWADTAGEAFGPDEFGRWFERIENDLDFGSDPGHGNSGAVPVERDADPLDPVSEAFLGAARGIGAHYRPDMNASLRSARSGMDIGPVPFNSLNGVRADMASCYLAPVLADRDNLVVRSATRVRKLLWSGTRVVGVEAELGGELVSVAADRVVLAAGAIGSPALLLASGVGDPHVVRMSGVDPVVELPGVGAKLFNHPTVDLSYVPSASRSSEAAVSNKSGEGQASFMQLVLRVGSHPGAGAFEVMATRRPYGVVTGQETGDTSLSMRVTLMRPESRGSLQPAPSRPLSVEPPAVIIDHDPLGVGADRDSIRSAVRFADELLRSSQFAPLVGERLSPSVADLASEEHLDHWLSTNTGFSFHQMGTCAMGTGKAAVVNPSFRVHGVDGLAVVDASVIPVGLSAGPAATVVALAEMAAQALGSEWC